MHPVFIDEAYELIEDSPVEEMVVTDSVPLDPDRPSGKIRVISVARMLAEAIRRIHTGESVSALFSEAAVR